MKLVMRDTELRLLREHFERCGQGRGGVVVVSGALGAGKTALLQAFSEDVDPAAHVANATASRVEQSLPMGVIDQLLRGTNLPAERAEVVDRLVAHGVLDAVAHSATDGGAQVRPSLLRGVYDAFGSLSTERPVVIIIDDLQFIDQPSSSCLLYLIRRLRSQRILVVMGECTHNLKLSQLLQSEILRLPHVRQIRLGALPEQGVNALLAQVVDQVTADRLTAHCLAITGGNPLLLRGLAEDFPNDPATCGGPVVGAAFCRTVMGCLYRAESSLLDIAHAVAVLGGATTVPLISELIGTDHQSVIAGIDILTESGLLDAERFRHDSAQSTVLDSMPIDLRRGLHRRAADILHTTGAPTQIVARHLAAGREAGPAWAGSVLLDSARLALFEGDGGTAIDYLRLAYDGSSQPRQRAEATAALAETHWRVNPTAAKRYLPELCTAARAGLLTEDEITSLLAQLSWQGRFTDALALLADLRDQKEVLVDLALLTEYLGTLVPGLANNVPPDKPGTAPQPSDRTGTASGQRLGDRPDMWRRAVDVLRRVVLAGPDPHALSEAQQVLHKVRPAVKGLPPAVYTLMALFYGDQMDLAADACDLLLKDDCVRGHPTWQALISVIRAGISTRLGELPKAEEQINVALTLLPVADWAAAVSAPLAVMIRATTSMGMFDTAAIFLDQPVPDATFATIFGLDYLSARGHFHLATGQAGGALHDFHRCGELMRRWSLDRPDLVPWRTDMAEALLVVGARDQALELAKEQFALVGSSAGRTRGITLRVLAAAREPEKRAPLLHEAVNLLETSGDQLSLAHTYADLSAAYQELDQPVRARRAAASALRLARQCNARPLEQRLVSIELPEDRTDPDRPGDAADRSGMRDRLTDAEQRVAVLAARGCSNLQIARRLYITVSTVEQHLTRVYRKLELDRRSQLKDVVGPGID
jgi:DNA-binding CsgD family transcriptional regulator